MSKPKVELLAPASGLESVRGAIFAGADAVYTGGGKFGARAYADNLVEDELLQAIDFVHLHGKKLYLTVNTLLKDKELKEELVSYLMPYYKQGLDAVIVQDLGVFSVVKEYFPLLPVHVSTQAVVTGQNSAKMFEKMGAERIVTARELSLDEIKAIRKNTSIEIESFVHGALCYCYSGQCLFSSFIGGRSGNRGRCAQPCRLPYELLDNNGKSCSKNKDSYLLSPKDMCTIEILPDIIEAGVFSLKIEGRMKRMEYTAGVTEIYRKYLDLYLQKGREEYKVSQKDKERLMELYNRGNFHTGYYTTYNGKSMMAMERPNHNGIYVGELIKEKNRFSMKTEIDLNQKDVLEFRGVIDKKTGKDLELTVLEPVSENGKYVLPSKYGFLLENKKKVSVYRTKNEKLLDEIYEKYGKNSKNIDIEGAIKIEEGKPVEFTASKEEIRVNVIGKVVDKANNQPVTEEFVKKQLNKTGNSGFAFKQLNIDIKGNCFLTPKELNQLRREALLQLENKLTKAYRREEIIDCSHTVTENNATITKDEFYKDKVKCHIGVETLEQLQVVLKFPQVDAVDISFHTLGMKKGQEEQGLQRLKDIKKRCEEADCRLHLVFPHIWRLDVEERIKSYMNDILAEIDGIVAKNMEVLNFVNVYNKKNIPIRLDYTAYAMNTWAVESWKDMGAESFTMPLELNRAESFSLAAQELPLNKEIILYGHIPMMVSAQCPVKNVKGCQNQPQIHLLKDRKGNKHPVCNYCDTCYAVIYNCTALSLLDVFEDVLRMNPSRVRICFTIEKEKEVVSVMKEYIQSFENGQKPKLSLNQYTRGHWKRGVE